MIIVLQAERPATFGPSKDYALAYLTSIVGILKIVAIIIALVAFLCSVGPGGRYIGDGWVGFATLTAVVGGIIWFLLNILNVVSYHTISQYIEIINYAAYTIFLLIAGIIVAVAAGNKLHPAHQSYGASAFFCFLSMFLFAADAALHFLQMRGTTSSIPAVHTGNQPQPSTVSGGNEAADPKTYTEPHY